LATLTGTLLTRDSPWTLQNWAPSTFLGIEVNRISAGVDAGSQPQRLQSDVEEQPEEAVVDDNEDTHSDEPTSLLHPHTSSGASTPPAEKTLELSGIYFGILNIYITIPQVLANVVCYFVFSVLDKDRLEDPDSGKNRGKGRTPNAIGVCFFLGAVCALMAAWNTSKLR